MLVGFATFPLLARHLDVGAYGLLGLMTTSATLMVAFGKLGLQHAILRFYPAAQLQREGKDLDEMHSTVFVLFAVLIVLSVIAWLIAGWMVVPLVLSSSQLPGLFPLLAIFIVFRMLSSLLSSMLRSQEQSRAIGLSTMAGRLLYLLLLYGVGLMSGFSIPFVLSVTVLAECLVLVCNFWAYRAFIRFDPTRFSLPLAKTLLVFGIPLMLVEAVGLLVRLTDRYMVGSFLGEFQLGQFAASTSLVSCVDLIVIGTIAAAVKPRYNRLWERSGRAKTVSFLQQGAEVYLLLGIPLAGLFIVIGKDVLVVLAGIRYMPGTVIIPYLTMIALLDGLLIFLLAGIHLKGKTSVFVSWGIITAVLNFAGNFLLIPSFGLEGAVAATLLAHLVFSIGLIGSAMRWLQIDVAWRPVLVVSFTTLVAVGVMSLLPFEPGPGAAVAKAALALPILVGIPLVTSAATRKWIALQSDQLIGRLHRAG